jgi:CBS domain-containing protein
MSVKSIVLWIFGGVAQLEGDTPDPRAELEVAAAGPATSLALAAAGAALAWVLGRLGLSSLIVASIGWLAGINALLALFNLLPAFPLDGGRILRAALWRRWRDCLRATEVAAKVGKAGGYVLIAVGAIEFLAGGGALGGIWLALIGWFITVAADQQPELIRQQHRTQGLTTGEAMSANPLVIPAGATVAEAIERYVLPNRFSAYPVADADGRFVGLVSVRRMAELPRVSWPSLPVMAAAVAPSDIVECRAQDRLADVGAHLQGAPERRAIALEGGRVVGILTASDVARAIARADQASAADSASQGRGVHGVAWGRARQP